jgi:hypothetical protein
VEDFYEDDEPAAEVIAAFEAGDKVLTSPFGIPVTAVAPTRLDGNRVAAHRVPHAS